MEVGVTRWVKGEQGWLKAGLCLVVEACPWRSCWRTGEEWRAEEARSTAARGEDGESGCPLSHGGGTCEAKCRQVWRDGCRWGTGAPGRTDSG